MSGGMIDLKHNASALWSCRSTRYRQRPMLSGRCRHSDYLCSAPHTALDLRKEPLALEMQELIDIVQHRSQLFEAAAAAFVVWDT